MLWTVTWATTTKNGPLMVRAVDGTVTLAMQMAKSAITLTKAMTRVEVVGTWRGVATAVRVGTELMTTEQTQWTSLKSD